MIDPDDLDAEIRDRVAAKIFDVAGRRERRRRVRAELDRRRAHGLKRRAESKAAYVKIHQTSLTPEPKDRSDE